MSMLILVVVMVVFFWWMSHSAKKQQQKMREQREAILVVGTNVVTQSGFFGTIVDIDGDAVTLESPSGTETVWLRSMIAQAMDIPVADISEEEAAEQDAQLTGERDDQSAASQNDAFVDDRVVSETGDDTSTSDDAKTL